MQNLNNSSEDHQRVLEENAILKRKLSKLISNAENEKIEKNPEHDDKESFKHLDNLENKIDAVGNTDEYQSGVAD